MGQSQKLMADAFEAYVGGLLTELKGNELDTWVGRVFCEEVFPEVGILGAGRMEKIAEGEGKGSGKVQRSRKLEGELSDGASRKRCRA